MTMINNEATGSRKKYLVPLVVLLLCAVALTGAGYAYNATINTTEDSVTVYSFELTTADRSDSVTITIDDLEFDTVKQKGDNGIETTYALVGDGTRAVQFYLINGVNTDKFHILDTGADKPVVTLAQSATAAGLSATAKVSDDGTAVILEFTASNVDAGKLKTIKDGFTVDLTVKAANGPKA